LLSKIIKSYADRIFIETDRNERFLYSDLGVCIKQMELVLEPRSLVCCLTNNSIGSIAGYLALMEAKAVPMLLDLDVDPALLQRLLSYYAPRYLWKPKVCSVAGLDKVVALFTLGDYELVAYAPHVASLHPDLGLLLSTSGSTGSPKFVRLSYRNVWSNAASIAEFLDLTCEERPITTLPAHYSYGLSVINSHVLVGATILVTNTSVMQREFWTFAKAARASSIAGVPYTYEMLRRLRFFSMDLPDLRTMTQAGGKFARERIGEFVKFAKDQQKVFVVMYGQTEATARMSYLPFNMADEKLGSVGVAIPGGEFFLLDDAGAPIDEPGVTGNLMYRGPNVSMGYAECAQDLALGDVRLGLLDTGDLASRDEDGFYFLWGRTSRFVKVYGNRIGLDEVESLAKQVTPDCACTGVDDLISVFVTEDGLREPMRAFLADKTGLNRRAFEVRLVQSIPKNSSGKIQYGSLSGVTQ
jgi:acyl-coenzyme A synthetase/AMP-(fatty) acid ligase